MWGAIILGGGSGQRMGAKCNKVLLPIAGKSMIVRSVEAFVPLVEQVVVVSREEDMPVMASELAQNGLEALMVSGGATRQESVWRGLQALSGQCDGVLVHDGARCLVTADVIQRCMASVEECGTGVAAVPVTDTIKTVSDANIALDTPNRTALRAVQTPQGFKTDLLRQAHEQAQRDGFLGTDDASLVERLGVPVQLTAGSRRNIKLTTPEDLLMAEAFFAEQALPALRVGQGYDVHRLVEDRPLILCGGCGCGAARADGCHAGRNGAWRHRQALPGHGRSVPRHLVDAAASARCCAAEGAPRACNELRRDHCGAEAEAAPLHSADAAERGGCAGTAPCAREHQGNDDGKARL